MHVDNNGIVRFESLDTIAPLQVGLNAALESVSDALDSSARIWPVANAAERDNLGNGTPEKPLFAYRADTGNLEKNTGSGWEVYPQPVEDTGWVNLTLTNGWTTVGGSTPQVRKHNGVVYYRGEILGSNTGSANPFTTVPVQFRRNTRSRYPAGWGIRLSSGGFLSLESSGEMYASEAFPSSPGLFLDVITPYIID